MLKGLEPELLIRLRREHPQAVMVIKTDGARKRAFKAPGPDEPLIPPFSDICVLIAGLDSIGRPLDERHVHRPEIVARLAEVESDTPMTPEIMARVVAHPRAYLPKFPPGAKRVLYLTRQSRNEFRSTKSEIRNPKQIQSTKLECSKLVITDFLSFGFGISNLFRISCFGFRISK